MEMPSATATAGPALLARGHLGGRAAIRAGDQGRRPASAAGDALRSVPACECTARAAHQSCRRARCSAQLPLELYMQERQFRYRVMGLAFADAQWDTPTPDGLTVQTRWWIDDMYMITALQLQAYRATGDAKYLERAAHRDGRVSRRSCRNPTACSSTRPTSNIFWGRGDGWVAVGMAEMLRELPAKHKLRKPILAAYREDDGDAAHVPGGHRHVAPAHRQRRRAGPRPRARPCSPTPSSAA